MLKKICWLALLFAGAVSVHAAPQSKDYRAIIAAPAEVQLATTDAFSIVIGIERLKERSGYPPKLKLWSSAGSWQISQNIGGRWQTRTGESPLAIAGFGTTQTATILLSGQTGHQTVRVDVTTDEEDYQVLGSAEIKLLRPKQVEFTDVPRVVRADGKTTESITVRVTGSDSKGIAQVPLMLRGNGAPSEDRGKTDLVLAATTDKEGYATFILPPSSRPGIALLQLHGEASAIESLISPQLEIHYQTDVSAKEQWLIEDPEWWQKPMSWG